MEKSQLVGELLQQKSLQTQQPKSLANRHDYGVFETEVAI